MKEIKVSLAEEKDRPQLRKYFEHYQNKEALEKRVDCYLTHNFTVAAGDGEEIIGILQWYIKEDIRAGVAEFEEVYVLDSHRGMGVGSLLVEKGIETVKEQMKHLNVKPRRIYLFVGKENNIARKLYEKHGFKQKSEVGNLFSDDKTELFYVLDLNQGTSK